MTQSGRGAPPRALGSRALLEEAAEKQMSYVDLLDYVLTEVLVSKTPVASSARTEVVVRLRKSASISGGTDVKRTEKPVLLPGTVPTTLP